MTDTASQVDALISHALSSTKAKRRSGSSGTTTTTTTTTTSLASRERLRRHLLRVLGSVLGSSNVNSGSEESIVESVKKNLNRREETNRKAIRFQELVGRVRRSGNVSNRWAVLHLLKQLQGSGSPDVARSIRASVAIASAAASSSSSHQQKNGGVDVAAVDSLIYGPSGGPNEGADDFLARARKRDYVEPTRFFLEENMTAELSEQALIRDVVYAFQGIDGTYVRWSDRTRGYVVAPDVGVPASVRSMVGKLCELGFLFRKVTTFIQR
jgi:gamma-tubulin complex component 3